MSGTRHTLAAVAAFIGLTAAAWAAADQPGSAPSTQPAAPIVEYVGKYVWSRPDADFGGFSGIELSPDGMRYTALSDRATLWWGTVERDAQDRVRGMTLAGQSNLRDSKGKALVPGYQGDSEGVAVAQDGRIFVSFEGLIRVAEYDSPDVPAKVLPTTPWFKTLGRNKALEALAITDDGALITAPELWPGDDPTYPLWKFQDGKWSTIGQLPRAGRWAAVAADVGPDGMLYLLQRDFQGLGGFANRLIRVDLTKATGPDARLDEQVLLQTSYRQYGNLEGLSIWKDGQGLRATMISDDNFLMLLQTEIVEYRIRN